MLSRISWNHGSALLALCNKVATTTEQLKRRQSNTEAQFLSLFKFKFYRDIQLLVLAWRAWDWTTVRTHFEIQLQNHANTKAFYYHDSQRSKVPPSCTTSVEITAPHVCVTILITDSQLIHDGFHFKLKSVSS